MLVGSIRLSACSAAFCDATDVPLPDTPFTTATATYTVETGFSFLSGRIESWTATLSGYPFCTFNSLWQWKTRLTLTGLMFTNPVEAWDVASTSTASVTWTNTSSTNVTGSGVTGGSWRRPSDGTILATGIAWKAKEYTFTRTSRTGSHVQYAVTSASYLEKYDCCGNSGYADFDSLVPGSTASRTPSTPTSYIMRWAGAATAQVAGLNLTLKTAGVSSSPWFVDVQGGQVVFTDASGNQTTYSGLLSSVATSINAAGKFTAAVPTNVTSAAGTTDLRPFHSVPIGATTCTVGLPLVLVGDVLAPSTTGAGFGPFSFAANLGYPDTEAGLEQFMRSTWYPKSSSFENGTFYYIYGEFDGWLTLSTASWSKTPGSSVRTDTQVIPADSTDVTSKELMTARCKTNGESSCAEESDPSCNGTPYVYTPYLVDCNGTPYPDGCFPYGTCWCERQQDTTVDYAEVTRTATQTMTGSFVIA